MKEQLVVQIVGDCDSVRSFKNVELLSEINQVLMHRTSESEEGHKRHTPEVTQTKHVLSDQNITILTYKGMVSLKLVCNNHGELDRSLLERYCDRGLPSVYAQIVHLISQRLNTREIRHLVQDLHQVSVSSEEISRIADVVMTGSADWQNRPINDTYAIVYIDLIDRRDHKVCIVTGIDQSGYQSVLGAWFCESESVDFWKNILNDLAAQGLEKMAMVIGYDLYEFSQVLDEKFPNSILLTCMVRLIRASLVGNSHQECRELATVLQNIFESDNEKNAERVLASFEKSELAARFPEVVRLWRERWAFVTPIFSFSGLLRRAMYTTSRTANMASTVNQVLLALTDGVNSMFETLHKISAAEESVILSETVLDELLDVLFTELKEWEAPTKYIKAATFRKLESHAQIIRKLFKSAQLREKLPSRERIFRFLDAPEKTWKSANVRYIAGELARSREFFDCIEKRNLTLEQRLAVVIDERSNLVVAAPGTGKTSVIVAKTGWLIERGHCQPTDLLVLAFTKNARTEMQKRLTERLGSNLADAITVSTFHGIGYHIIKNVEKKPSVHESATDEVQLLDFVRSIVDELLCDRDFSRAIRTWFQEHFRPSKSEFEFSNQREYLEYIKRFDLRTLKGHQVRSFEECDIANFLFLNGIPYEYEPSYEHDTRTSEYDQYRPDFLLPEHGIYIEHFGIDAQGDTARFVDRESYLASMEWKRREHTKHGTVLIETFTYEKIDGRLLQNLKRELGKHGVALNPISDDEVFAELNRLGQIIPFTELVTTLLGHFKSQGMTKEDIESALLAQKSNSRERAFLSVFQPIYTRYTEILRSLDQIDFHDMINRATEHLTAQRFQSRFKYILVDEIQDISISQARLLKALLESSPKSQLLAVGDDWQAIHRFRGADSSIMREFNQHFAHFERMDLTTTFRCSKRIMDVANKFLLHNPYQIPKTVCTLQELVTTPGKLYEPAVHIGFPETSHSDAELLLNTLDQIAKHAKSYRSTPDVLVLGRRSHEVKSQEVTKLLNRYPLLNVTLQDNIHQAKGMEADYVVLLGLCCSSFGFPSEVADDPLLNLVMAIQEDHPNGEERRLLYVAMTRARRMVFLLATGGTTSVFAKELVEDGYFVRVFGRSKENVVICPNCTQGKLRCRVNPTTGKVIYSCIDCGESFDMCPIDRGYLTKKTGKFGTFLGCSKFPFCDYTRSV